MVLALCFGVAAEEARTSAPARAAPAPLYPVQIDHDFADPEATGQVAGVDQAVDGPVAVGPVHIQQDAVDDHRRVGVVVGQFEEDVLGAVGIHGGGP